MKLLYITNGITGSGGLERVLSVKASLLAENYAYEVHILSLNEKGKSAFFSFSEKIQFHNLEVFGNPVQYFFLYKKGIQNFVKTLQPEIISVCDDGLKGFFLPLLLKTNAKIIYERHVSKLIESNIHQNSFRILVTKLKWFLMEKLAANFSRVILLTKGNKKEWLSLKNIEVIPNPLSFYSKEIAALQSKTVICVGKICYQKGQDILVEIWDIVRKKHPEWKLELYGTPNESFLNTSELATKNIFHFPATKDILQKYLQSSIYVMPSRFEGFGMVLTEAMSCGVPCIAFDCDYGPGDIITNNSNGYLIDNVNLQAFAEKIIDLIEQPEERKRLGDNAKIASLSFDQKIILEKWNHLFKMLKKQV